MLTQEKTLTNGTRQIRDLMLPAEDQIAPDEPARRAQRRLEALTIRSLIVVDGDRPVGIITMHELLDADPDQLIAQCMHHQIPILHADLPVDEARQIVETIDVDFDRLPVVEDDGKLVGEVLRSTLLHDETSAGQTKGIRIHIERPNGSFVRRWLAAGTPVIGAGGGTLGEVDEMQSDNGKLTAFYVKYGLLGRKHKRLPADVITDLTDEGLHLSIDKSEFKLLADVESQS